jgi:hypothetical protein
MLFHCANTPCSKWYITGEDANKQSLFALYSHLLLDISIECMLDNSDHFNPTMMEVNLFSSEKGQGEVLHFQKVSSQEWKNNAAIVL